MPVSAGTRLGPYEVVELLGAGGMGEVYRARDTRLDRDVALKVLPEDVAHDQDRLKRFELEARTIAALNHPHILTVHDVGSHGDTHYVVTELLDGESLREVVARRSPTQRQVLAWAVQAAQGLAAAHRKGIVHRDLKPENVFLTTDGRIKILDFGLAKLAGGPAADTEAITESSPTGPGLLMGTIPYMSPEQVQGRLVDARSDIFSFGVVLYELLARKHPFRRETVGATVGAILQETPVPLVSLDPTIPLALDGVARRCLEKRREDRFQGAHDLGLALEALLAAPTGSAALQEVEERSPYPGLQSFTERDASVFFGREAEVKALWERIRSRSLLAVIGPSGAGKTSFLRAGVLPARPQGWAAILCTPGTAPFVNLGRALAPELAADRDALQELLRFDEPEVALALITRWRRFHPEALVVVDQFEELFTLNPPEAQARFAALLARLASEGEVHVVLSLRDDFLLRCCEQPPLAPILKELTALLAMGGSDLRRALVEPAKKRGYRFDEEALVGEMVSMVEGVRGALPLLAFAVARLWEKRDRDRKLLTREAYREIAGVEGALAQHAEATMDRIGSEHQATVREILRNLVTAQGTRAVMDREELLSAFPHRPAAEDVLRQLIDARLLTTYEVEGKEGEASHHRVEVVHESLLKAWPRLVRWQAQDEEGAVLRDQLKQAARLWDEKGRTSDLLWTGTAFQEFELWRGRYAGALTAIEEDFAKAMREKAQRRRRLLRAAAAAVVLASTSVAIAIAISHHQAVLARQRAEEEARRAEASKLVALGKLEMEVDPTAALAYARKSLEVHDTAEARRLALEALWRGPVARVLAIAPGQQGCNRVAASPDGQWLACSWWGNVIQLFSSDAKTTRVLPNNRNAARIRTVLFSEDSKRLATFASGDPETVVWSVDGQEIARLRPGGFPRRFVGDELTLVEEPHAGRPESEIVIHTIGSDKPRSLDRVRVSASDVNVVRASPLWDADLPRASLVHSRDRVLLVRPLGEKATARADLKLGEHGAGVADVAVHDGPGWIVSFDETHEVRIWDGATRRLLRSLAGTDADPLFRGPVLDPRGVRLAWQTLRRRAFVLWDLAGPPDAEPLLMHKGEVAAGNGNGAFLAEGRWLATALSDRVAFWPLEMPWPRVLRGEEGGAGAGGLAFTPDSKQLVSCGTNGVRVYPMAPDAPPTRPIPFESRRCYGVAMDPAGGRVLIAATGFGVLAAPLDGTSPQPLLRVRSTESICPVAFDPAGRRAATAACYSPDVADRLLHIVDLRTGRARTFPLPGATAEAGWSGGVQSLRFVSDGRLVTGGVYSGLRRWDPETGSNEALNGTPCVSMDASADGHRIVASCKPAGTEKAAEATKAGGAAPQPPYELLVFDVSTGGRRRIDSHGRDIVSVATNPAGDVIATADSTGSVHVGRIDGGEPHLIPGAGQPWTSLAFSPDGRWIASTAGNDIRLWPMPDMTKPPLHTLPREALLAKLGSLTNVRVVEDRTAPTGYKLDLAPFPGWKDVPTW